MPCRRVAEEAVRHPRLLLQLLRVRLRLRRCLPEAERLLPLVLVEGVEDVADVAGPVGQGLLLEQLVQREHPLQAWEAGAAGLLRHCRLHLAC